MSNEKMSIKMTWQRTCKTKSTYKKLKSIVFLTFRGCKKQKAGAWGTNNKPSPRYSVGKR